MIKSVLNFLINVNWLATSICTGLVIIGVLVLMKFYKNFAVNFISFLLVLWTLIGSMFIF